MQPLKQTVRRFLAHAMIIIQPTKLHWIKDVADDQQDLCAHSPVDFRISNMVFVRPEDGDWTVSASALYLLRTLTRDHTQEQPVGDHLFPCCGFSMYDIEGEEDVVICGCPSGRDCSVRHIGSEVQLSLESGQRVLVSSHDWRAAVHAFSDAVRAFYQRYSPKQPFEPEDVRGFDAFQREWDRRRYPQ